MNAKTFLQIPIFLLAAFILVPIKGLSQEAAPDPYEPHKSKDYLVFIETQFGEMVVLLYDETPLHKSNFLQLAEDGYYDSTSFHRIISGFMIQGGDPNSKPGGDPGQVGLGGPGYTIPAEFRPNLTHRKGALAAARQPDGVNPQKASSGSQFYIVHREAGCRHLNGSYTVFGQVIDGLEIIDMIAASSTSAQPGTSFRMSMRVKRMKKKKIAKLYDIEE